MRMKDFDSPEELQAWYEARESSKRFSLLRDPEPPAERAIRMKDFDSPEELQAWYEARESSKRFSLMRDAERPTKSEPEAENRPCPHCGKYPTAAK